MSPALPRRGLAATLVVLAVAALLALHPAGPVRGASIAVTTTDDELNSDGDCSLREAIQAANTNAVVDTCTAGNAGADTISLPAGTYTLAIAPDATPDDNQDGDLDVSESVIIQGAGAGSTIIQACTASQVSAPCGTGSGQNGGTGVQDRVFHLFPAATTVTISGVTVRHGRSVQGGGILTTAVLTLEDSVLQDNRAVDPVFIARGGGIASTNTLEIRRSTVTGNRSEWGGGISGTGPVTVEDSTVTGNGASDPSLMTLGGGIYVDGTLTVQNSTVSGNTADLAGAGIYIDDDGVADLLASTVSGNTSLGDGGGIAIAPGGSLTMLLSTVSGNTAAVFGGGMANLGTVRASFVTVAGNTTGDSGGGIFNDDGVPASTELRGVILADNTAGVNGPDCAGTLTSGGYNLVEELTGCAVTPTTGDVTGQDPLLGLLGANGGPTETHALLAGSPAVETVPAADCEDLDGNAVTADQRGVARPQGAACDVGAYEADNVAQLTVTRGGSGSGTVTSDDGGIVCGTACTRFYITGDTVTLTAAPGAGSVFTGWSGGCMGNAAVTTVTMTAAVTCTATFGLAPPPTPTPTPTPTPPSTPTPTPTPLPDGIRLPETGSGGDAAGRVVVPAALLVGALLLAGGALARRRAR